MNFLSIIFDIPILIVLSVFIFSTFYCITKYYYAGKHLSKIIKYISLLKKNDLNYKFKEIDDWMTKNPYISAIWIEFKNTLVFSESIALDENKNLSYENVSDTVQNVQTTSDVLFYFNEETLVNSKFNYKMIQTIPTVLTGFGPLFTFLNIALAFGRIDFSTQEKTIASISGFMNSMQSAALVSVIAVGSSLIYLFIERIMYSKICKAPTQKIQELLGNLFASISAEKFLYELLRESKVQSNSATQIMSRIPDSFKQSFNSGVANNLVPYLENVIFGLNQLNSQLRDFLKKNNSDDIDDLF